MEWYETCSSAKGTGDVRLNYTAQEVRMVLSGSGTVTYRVDGVQHTVNVDGTPKSYRLVKTSDLRSGTLDVSLTHGVQAFSFTFG
ncbi:MAG: hypothetical protein ABI255_10370 [Microbacteriaceae bacterium]